jgi:hypothetical protein
VLWSVEEESPEGFRSPVRHWEPEV